MRLRPLLPTDAVLIGIGTGTNMTLSLGMSKSPLKKRRMRTPRWRSKGLSHRPQQAAPSRRRKRPFLRPSDMGETATSRPKPRAAFRKRLAKGAASRGADPRDMAAARWP